MINDQIVEEISPTKETLRYRIYIWGNRKSNKRRKCHSRENKLNMIIQVILGGGKGGGGRGGGGGGGGGEEE